MSTNVADPADGRASKPFHKPSVPLQNGDAPAPEKADTDPPAAVSTDCPDCGAPSAPDARFCTECGTPLSVRRTTDKAPPWYRRRTVLIAAGATALAVAAVIVVVSLLTGGDASPAGEGQGPFMNRVLGNWSCTSDDGAVAHLAIAPGTFAFDTTSPSGMQAVLRGTWEVDGWRVKVHTTEGGTTPEGSFTPIDLGGRFELITENAQGTINSDLAKPFLELHEGDHTAILRFTFQGRRIQVVCSH